VLRSFLDHPARSAGTLRYHELQGFLFTIASAPDLVRPSEWMPIVFGESG
jgi:yecA family protein